MSLPRVDTVSVLKKALNSNKHVRHSIWDGKGHKQCCITNKKLKVKTTPGFTLFYARFIHKHHLHFVFFPQVKWHHAYNNCFNVTSISYQTLFTAHKKC